MQEPAATCSPANLGLYQDQIRIRSGSTSSPTTRGHCHGSAAAAAAATAATAATAAAGALPSRSTAHSFLLDPNGG